MAKNKKSFEEEKIENKKEDINNQEIMVEEPPQFWKTILKYAITITIAGGLVFAVLGINGFFLGGYDKAQYYRKLSDAFTIPGLLLIFLAFLFFVSQQGAFTGLGYALRHVARMLLPFIIRKDITYAEYVERREKRKAISTFLCFILVGAAFLIVGVIFIFSFYKYYQPVTA